MCMCVWGDLPDPIGMYKRGGDNFLDVPVLERRVGPVVRRRTDVEATLIRTIVNAVRIVETSTFVVPAYAAISGNGCVTGCMPPANHCVWVRLDFILDCHVVIDSTEYAVL